MIFRAIALILMLGGGLVAAAGLLISSMSYGPFGVLIGLFYSLPATVFGIILYWISKPLARFICYDFDTFTDA